MLAVATRFKGSRLTLFEMFVSLSYPSALPGLSLHRPERLSDGYWRALACIA